MEGCGCVEVILGRIGANIERVGEVILGSVIWGLMMVLGGGVGCVVMMIVGVLMVEM